MGGKSITFHLEEHKDQWCIMIDAYQDLDEAKVSNSFVQNICDLFKIPYVSDWQISHDEIWIKK